MNPSEGWVDVRCSDLEEARWFRMVLDQAGIQVLIPDEHTLGLPLGADAEAGTIRLLVRAVDFERAVAVLAAHPRPVS